MTARQPCTREQRRADTLARLTALAADVWVATAAVDAGGHASCYLLRLSVAWIDERVVLATEADSVTARNITGQGRARLGFGPTRDVVMIDAELEHGYGLDEVPAGLARRYAAQADWDPREALWEGACSRAVSCTNSMEFSADYAGGRAAGYAGGGA